MREAQQMFDPIFILLDLLVIVYFNHSQRRAYNRTYCLGNHKARVHHPLISIQIT